jgi:hypothetical protein
MTSDSVDSGLGARPSGGQREDPLTTIQVFYGNC